MKNYAAEYSILLIDDSSSDIMFLEMVLKEEGYLLFPAAEAADVVAAAGERHPNLILLNLPLHQENKTFDLLRHLKGEPCVRHIPVILLLTGNDMATIVKGYRFGAEEYLFKPLQKEDVKNRIAHFFQLYSIERMRQELENTLEAHDMLYAIISHDLRRPLGSLKTLSRAILNIGETVGTGNKDFLLMLTRMNCLVEDTYQLLDNLMKWNKLKEGKLRPFRQKTDIGSLLETILSVYQPITALKGVTLRMETPLHPVLGLVDIDMTKTILRNLLLSTIQFGADEGEILVRLEAEGDKVVFLVRNDNWDMSEAECQKLLTAEHPHVDKDGQFGSLGLSMFVTRRFVEFQRGSISYQGSLEAGGNFLVTLPVQDT
ncbi:MAG: response regulator [Tannerella sp.]|jgi:two-component system sensor histidine kinase/response regulator|nr:response regulator [Tannerella sp.]